MKHWVESDSEASALETATAAGAIVIFLLRSHKGTISWQPRENLALTFTLESRMNWLDLRDRMSKSAWPHTTHFFFFFWSDDILHPKRWKFRLYFDIMIFFSGTLCNAVSSGTEEEKNATRMSHLIRYCSCETNLESSLHMLYRSRCLVKHLM